VDLLGSTNFSLPHQAGHFDVGLVANDSVLHESTLLAMSKRCSNHVFDIYMTLAECYGLFPILRNDAGFGHCICKLLWGWNIHSMWHVCQRYRCKVVQISEWFHIFGRQETGQAQVQCVIFPKNVHFKCHKCHKWTRGRQEADKTFIFLILNQINLMKKLRLI
jgi:hypothetical protein